MGWIVWCFESLLSLAASYALAVAMYPDRGAVDRAVVALIVQPCLILAAMQLCGVPGHLAPVALGLTSLLVFGGTLALAVRAGGLARLREIAALDARAPVRLARDAWREREVALVTLVPAAVVLTVVCLMVWYFRSWTWDPVWYHVPKTGYVIQTHSLDWMNTPIDRTQGFAQNIEVLAAWNCIFQMDNRLDDSSQVPFTLLGMLLVAAWARKLGAGRPLAAALGAAWVALPPIFLQAHSTHNDIACGVLCAAVVYFAREAPTRRDRWMALLALGLYTGTKFTGLFHTIVLAPWLVSRAAWELWRARGERARTLGDVVLSLGGYAAVGIHKYVQNALHTGNPMFPFPLRLPVIHKLLPGSTDIELNYGLPAGESPAFFGTPHAFKQILESWGDTSPFYCPDVRTGGFGMVFCGLLVPCVVAVAADAVRGRDWRRGLPVVGLFGVALVVPAAWFPRYIIGASVAGLLAFASVHAGAKTRTLQFCLSTALAGLVCAGTAAGFKGFITFPRDFARAVEARTPAERAALKIDTFLWDTRWAMARENEMRPGDVIAYDESVHFLGDLFCWDFRTRVEYVSSAGSPSAYVERLRALRPRWVGVARGSAAARAVAAAGGEFLFVAPTSHMALLRMHWQH